MDNNFEVLLKKLDVFIKKYYFNKIIKGLLLAISVYAAWYIAIVLIEYFGRLSTNFRTVLFATTIILYSIIFITMILIPILQLFKIGKTINYKDASKIIGKYFPEVSDKLLNILELKELINSNQTNYDIILASINQKTIKISPIPFVSAINLKKNIKYLKYFVPPILIIILLLCISPQIISDPTERLINFNKFYKEPAPFEFILLNDTLIVKKGQDFTVELETKGKMLPENVNINYGGNDFFMEKVKNGNFKYTFKNLNNNLKFSFSAINLKSDTYNIEVLPAPIIVDFKIVVTPPAYTNLETKTYNNSGDLTVPIGSNIFWTFNTSNIDRLTATFDSVSFEAKQKDKLFSFTKQLLKPTIYSLKIKNNFFDEDLGILYKINTIPDLYPTIGVNSLNDSAQLSALYFNGFIEDDYGFTNLTFNCIPGEKSDTLITINIPFSKNMIYQEFYYAFDFASLNIKGKNISYYFEISDNDGIHGPKKTKTEIKDFSIPNADDIKQLTEKNNQETESKIEQAAKINQKIRKDIENFKKKMLNEKMTGYEKKQAMQQIFDQQQQLQNLMNDIKNLQNQTLNYKEQFSKNEELIKKQEEINKLLEAMMDEEMKKMMEDMQKLMDNFNPEDFMKLAEKMDYSTKELEKEMDNTLELLKKTEVEDNFKKSIEDLKDLAKDQDKLSEDSKNKEFKKEDLLLRQQEQEKQFEKIKEEIKENLEKNKDLEEPVKMKDIQEDMKNISETFQETKQDMKEGKQQKASKSQKKNSQQMEEMADKMESAMSENEDEQNAEDMGDLRQILENLLYFSFTQEDIMKNMKNLSNRDPKFKELIVKQKNLENDFEIIRDSLNILARRIAMISPMISKDVSIIYQNLKLTMDNISSNLKNNIERSQQTVMTSANNLTLLLFELLQQMQQQQANSQQKKSGKQCNNCKNPGNGQKQQSGQQSKNGPTKEGEMRDKQQGLKRQMQEMLDNMKNGKGDKNGKQPSEALAKMLMQQEMLKQMLNEMKSGASPEQSKILQQIDQMMEQNISDLINGNVTPNTINRQDQIITRLLQAENAEKERETDNKRKSNEAKDYKFSNPDEMFKEKNKELRFNELLQQSNMKLTPYYKNKYKDYLKSL